MEKIYLDVPHAHRKYVEHFGAVYDYKKSRYFVCEEIPPELYSYAPKKYRSEAYGVVDGPMESLHEVGAISKQTMREFDETCLTSVQAMAPEHIRALREREHLSQPSFALYLNVSKNLVSDQNPFAPGAGVPPPELAGRDKLRERVRVATERARLGLPAKSVIVIGLRGVGKTVLLDRMRQDVETSGMLTLRIDVADSRSLLALLTSNLRLALLKLTYMHGAKKQAIRALRALAGFAGKHKSTCPEIEVGLDFEPASGLADCGELEVDLATLLECAGVAARVAGTGLIFFIDELQRAEARQLAAFVAALELCVQEVLPVMMVGAGLPQLQGHMDPVNPYVERLFDFQTIGALDVDDARQAIVEPCRREGVEIEPAAVARIIKQSGGYPYFLQEWGKQTWYVAKASPIRVADVDAASKLAVASLDERFFRRGGERLTLSEQNYLRAMAELGSGPHRSGDIAELLGRSVQSLGPVRANLIRKGAIWSPTYGDTAFMAPLFDEFMRRIM